jgi:hypothetical protein
LVRRPTTRWHAPHRSRSDRLRGDTRKEVLRSLHDPSVFPQTAHPQAPGGFAAGGCSNPRIPRRRFRVHDTEDDVPRTPEGDGGAHGRGVRDAAYS